MIIIYRTDVDECDILDSQIELLKINMIKKVAVVGTLNQYVKQNSHSSNHIL